MTIDQRLAMERNAHRHESHLARYVSKFTMRCRQCMSSDGVRSVCREVLAMMREGRVHIRWYEEQGNDEYLFYACENCNWARMIPPGFIEITADEILTWLDRDPMAPDYAALATEEPVLASEDSRDSARMEG